jgi:molecular chaperone DnaK
MKDKNVASVKRGMEELTKVSHKLAEEIYKKAGASQKGQQGPGAGPGSQGPQQEEPEPERHGAGTGKKDDDVIDAEFRTEDDEGKKRKK